MEKPLGTRGSVRERRRRSGGWPRCVPGRGRVQPESRSPAGLRAERRTYAGFPAGGLAANRRAPLRTAICGARSRHKQLPTVGRAAGRAGVSRRRCILAHRPARVKVWRRPGCCPKTPWHARSTRSRSAPTRSPLGRVAAGRYVATEACRQAANCEAFLARVREEIGLEIEIISSTEEARLVVAGCAPLLNPRIPYAIVFDIGGGSTEIVWLRLWGGAQPGAAARSSARCRFRSAWSP